MHTKIVAKIHCPCYMAFLAKNALQVLPENIFYCGVKAHNSSAMKATNSFITEKSRWDADGPNGPDTEPYSILVSLCWWTTEGNYSKYQGIKDHSG